MRDKLMAGPLIILLLLLLHTPLISAHMSMSEPPALRYKTNPYKTQEDYDYSSPLSPSGSNYPCKGYAVDLGTPGGQSVRTYAAGGTYNLVLAGSATHAGGSCQLSLSYDGGKSWEVFKSFVGGCVMPEPGSSQTFKFTIPGGARSGEALFAWTWFNNLGNREMYMNCAVVTITGGGGGGGGGGGSGGLGDSGSGDGPLVIGNEGIGKRSTLEKRIWGGPSMFIANIGNGCSVPSGRDVMFPDPGSSVEYGGSEGSRGKPEGNCGSGDFGGSGGSGVQGGAGRTSGGGVGWILVGMVGAANLILGSGVW